MLDGEKRDSKRKANGANPGASPATGKSIMLPMLKPKSSGSEGKKQDREYKGETAAAGSTAITDGLHKQSRTLKSKITTIEIKKPDGNVRWVTVGASSTAIAAGRHKPSPLARSKASEIEAKKQNVKGSGVR
jgi:hypothetical protein